MEYDISVLAGVGIDTETGLQYTGNRDKYISALQRFYKGYEKNRKKTEDFLAAKDTENYMITVHALKSNARMIGALSLGESFEALELAAQRGDLSVMERDTAGVLSAYEKLHDGLKPIGDMEQIHPVGEISASEAKECAGKLLEALDDFDDRKAKELLKKLSGYPFRMTQAELLKEAEGYVDDFMYEEASEIVSRVSSAVEE